MNDPSTPDDFTLGPTVEFMQSLWRLNHALERLSRRMEANWGVTAQQRMIVRCVGRYPGITANQLARQLHVDAGTVSAALGRLERKGLLERRRADRDRRRLTLGLTAAGRAIDQVAGSLERAVETLLGASSGDELASTRRVLESLTLLLEAEGRTGSESPGDPATSDPPIVRAP
jgi:MarR family transcriptional regulator, organic hydroperoxide resistance regulator